MYIVLFKILFLHCVSAVCMRVCIHTCVKNRSTYTRAFDSS